MLPACLESIKGLDEIIICDTGSTDRTIEIAKQFTDKVFTDFVWCDSFAKARNHALSKASGDWVLSIDADETLESVEAVREAVAMAGDAKAVDVCIQSKKWAHSYFVPKLFKRDPEVFWKGDIHNHLSVKGIRVGKVKHLSDHSPAHANDPDRALRILTKVVSENPDAVREKFYLGREYFEKGHFKEAIEWMAKYLKVGNWSAEKAEAYLTIAKAQWFSHRGDLAREACLRAIQENPDFKEALCFMSKIHNSPYKEKWARLAEVAQNKDVLFVRVDSQKRSEKGSEYYDAIFAKSADMSRYEEISSMIAQIVGDQSVLELGCGTAELGKKIKDYKGFDFSEKAIELAADPRVWVGNIYEAKNYEGTHDYMVATEVFEHIDDFKAIENIPDGQKVIFSVPSFWHPSHLRVFTEHSVQERYKKVFDIKSIQRFNWRGKWELGGEPTDAFILLVEAVKLKAYKEVGIDGWMTSAELAWLYEQAQKHQTIAEVGSWKGRSTHALLTGNTKGTVTAIDTWKGSSDPKDKTHGRDTFADFMKNVGHFKNLTTNRNRGVDAANEYADKSFDMVFIDAGHTYEEVKEDIKAWLPKVKSGGILCGHDYHKQKWPGVVKAVDEAFGAPDGVADTIWFKNIT